MTEDREKLMERFQKWLDTDPRKQIIAAHCATIAEEYVKGSIKITELESFYDETVEDWHLWDESEQGPYQPQRILNALAKLVEFHKTKKDE